MVGYRRQEYERHPSGDMTLPARGSTIRLRFNSAFEMLDLVQVVSDRVARLLEFNLRGANYVVECAATGAEGLAAIHQLLEKYQEVSEAVGEVVDGGMEVSEAVSVGAGLTVPETVGRSRIALGAGEPEPQAEAINTVKTDRVSSRVTRMVC
jgi:hypothetical protein